MAKAITPAEARDALSLLYAAAMRLSDGARERGKGEGSSIIMRLAKGDMSLNDFNELTTVEA
jgi:hypothetical protein